MGNWKSKNNKCHPVDGIEYTVVKQEDILLSYADFLNNPDKYDKLLTVSPVDTPHTKKTIMKKKDKLVYMTIDYILSIRDPNPAYMIGYKMVYMVDTQCRKIPGVIAIITLRIASENNAVYESENTKNFINLYSVIKKTPDKYIGRDTPGDNTYFWEQSTKYCAYRVETIAITLVGRLKNVIVAAHMYDNDNAYAESAHTFDNKLDQVVYEVGHVNISKHKNPNVGVGKCLDFYHFFLHPQYAIDYGMFNFSLESGKDIVDSNSIIISKKFDSLTKVSYYNEIENSEKFVKNDKRYRTHDHHTINMKTDSYSESSSNLFSSETTSSSFSSDRPIMNKTKVE
jgi:hypothetical protein